MTRPKGGTVVLFLRDSLVVQKGQFRWKSPDVNPYLRTDDRATITSRYRDVAMALSHA